MKEGTYLYDGEIECDIRIVRSQIRWGTGDDGDEPRVRCDVEKDTFYVQYGSTSERGIFNAESDGFESLEEALTQVARTTIGPTICWA
ncbi:hypothetical protein DBV14_03825 [Variovorax sp. KBW07]|uniref:hypothetical protein n=1 Tax=Variovorax sp. KBW07 TaxID=2153358 RepID=UPI000F57EF83|nr:hypothetical protein [Variovorax sp. KBW07]RQO62798.1 hypothetical protein DBV14_03825 [Variovorax sp. KBW07]